MAAAESITVMGSATINAVVGPLMEKLVFVIGTSYQFHRMSKPVPLQRKEGNVSNRLNTAAATAAAPVAFVDRLVEPAEMRLIGRNIVCYEQACKPIHVLDDPFVLMQAFGESVVVGEDETVDIVGAHVELLALGTQLQRLPEIRDFPMAETEAAALHGPLGNKWIGHDGYAD